MLLPLSLLHLVAACAGGKPPGGDGLDRGDGAGTSSDDTATASGDSADSPPETGSGGDDSAALVDADGDGATPDAGDCDDADPMVHPGAPESCNGVDDDCDGGVDEADATNVPVWYADRDGDGYGDAARSVSACTRPAGYVFWVGDCDDADASVSPGAVERCDGIDDDCDGSVDGADAADAPAWHADVDGDGFGDPLSATVACTQLSDTVADATDCDDTSAAVSPAGTETCDGVDDDCDGVIDEDDATDVATWYADTDRDGFGDPTLASVACQQVSGTVPDATDCDDTDDDVNPGADETCDGVDDDCKGGVDEDDATDAATWYSDVDADGFGDPATVVTACQQPAAFVADATDCDDTSAAVHPGAAESDCADPVDYNCDGSAGRNDSDADGYAACEDCDDADASVSPEGPETCDGVDDDCDGAVDEDDAIDAYTWYTDADGDGYGDTTVAGLACTAPAAASGVATDCDDGDASVHPDAPEVCTSAVDDDCDGEVNERNASDCTRWYFDDDGDGYGSTSNRCLCESGDGFTADNDEDCDDGDGAVNPAATEDVDNGIDDDCDDLVDILNLDDSELLLFGEAESDQAGGSVASAGDFDGDGWLDVVVGARGVDPSATGAAYVVGGGASGALSLADADVRFDGESGGDWAGDPVAGGGDADGDGYDDLLVGAIMDADAGGQAGAVYLVRGGPTPASGSLASADTKWLGLTYQDWAGCALGFVGDVDGDGGDDLAVGACGNDMTAYYTGHAFLVSGTAPAGALDTVGYTFEAEATGDEVGASVATAGDFDGDGVPDVLIGAPGYSTGVGASGAAYVISGATAASMNLASADVKMEGDAYVAAGRSVAGGGDVDGDGYDDVMIGADDVVYVALGPGAALMSLSTSAVATFTGEADDYVGLSVAMPGDLDGDGLADVAVAAPGADLVYVLTGAPTGAFGPSDASLTLSGGYVGSLSGAGDWDGDGLDDLLIGSSYDSTMGDMAGAAYVVLSPF